MANSDNLNDDDEMYMGSGERKPRQQTNKRKDRELMVKFDEIYHRRIFFADVSFDVDRDGIKSFFERIADVENVHLMLDKNQRSRGFGFVTFVDAESVDVVMKERPLTIEGRLVDVRRAIPKQLRSEELEQYGPYGNKSKSRANKVFVGALSLSFVEKDLFDYFQQFGQVVSCKILRDKLKQSRGFAFVEFDDYDPVDKIILAQVHRIKGQLVDVKRAVEHNQRRQQMTNGEGYPPDPASYSNWASGMMVPPPWYMFGSMPQLMWRKSGGGKMMRSPRPSNHQHSSMRHSARLFDDQSGRGYDDGSRGDYSRNDQRRRFSAGVDDLSHSHHRNSAASRRLLEDLAPRSNRMSGHSALGGGFQQYNPKRNYQRASVGAEVPSIFQEFRDKVDEYFGTSTKRSRHYNSDRY